MTVIVIFLFSACVKHEDYSDETKRITMDVYDCLLEGDSEKLKSLFCENTRNSPDFDRKVQDFMDGIGGCISSGDVNEYHYDVASRRKLIYKNNPNIKYMHFGDIDAGGLWIHHNLCEITGVKFQLFCMSEKELADPTYKTCLHKLSENDVVRMQELKAIREYKNVVDFMIKNNAKLEQEIVSLRLMGTL